MPHIEAGKKKGAAQRGGRPRKASGIPSRFTVGLAPAIVPQVERYAQIAECSMSKAIANLVRLGLESQEDRKQEFFRKLRANLDDEDPKRQDELVDEFRALILGH